MSHNGSQFIAEEVTRHETGPSVVMNCTTYNNEKKIWIAAGQESHCQLYNVSSKVVTVKNGEVIKPVSDNTKESIRQRKNMDKGEETYVPEERIEEIKDDNSNIKSKRLQLIVKPLDSVQTDFR